MVHAGQRPDPTTGAVTTPVYLTSTYRQPKLDGTWPFDYARAVNPTRTALERSLAELEGGVSASCFASGMAAIDAVMNLLKAGDHVVVTEKVYGGTYRLFSERLVRHGLEFTWVDTSDPAAIEQAVGERTRMLYVETPTNPTLALTDLRRVARVSRKHGLIFTVDNTFMTPCLQRPLESGADLVVHSTTKFINGHSDSIGGAVIARDAERGEQLRRIQKSVGAILSPFDCYLVLRGVKTLALRMERHESNARQMAAWLAERPEIRTVHYPGLPTHPQHALARRQMAGFGAVVSFDLGTVARARRFLRRLRLCTLAESLGGVETLIAHPASMSHASLSPRDRKRLGVGGGLLRMSVGIETADDLIADLERGLRGLG